jgi:hypothetical protein
VQNVDHNIGFEKNANFFAENCQKSQKIVIITSTPDQPQSTNEYIHFLPWHGGVANWSSSPPTEQKIPGSNPAVFRNLRIAELLS